MNAAMVDLREYGDFLYRVVAESTIRITTDYSIDASSMMAAPQRRTAWCVVMWGGVGCCRVVWGAVEWCGVV